MNLTKKEFTSKYCNASDSLTLQNQLSILEADLLINEHAFLEETQIFLDGCSVKFLSEFAFATSDKFIYKRGDTLKVFANISRFPEKFKGRAIIDGKGAEFKDHYFTYSRVITEAPGQYYIPVQIIWEDENKKENIYPAQAPFVVK